MSYAVAILVPTRRVGTSAGQTEFLKETQFVAEIRTRSVRAAFPRGAWERDRSPKNSTA